LEGFEEVVIAGPAFPQRKNGWVETHPYQPALALQHLRLDYSSVEEETGFRSFLQVEESKREKARRFIERI
jgi:hypothetical protein